MASDLKIPKQAMVALTVPHEIKIKADQAKERISTREFNKRWYKLLIQLLDDLEKERG